MMNADDDGHAAGEAKAPAKKAPATTTSSDGAEQKKGFMDKVKFGFVNCCSSTGLCCFKLKSQTQISALEFKIANRQKKFGVDYLTLVERKASQAALKECLKEALRDIAELQTQVNDHYDNIDNKASEVQQKTGSHDSAAAPDGGANPKPKKKRNEGGAPAAAAQMTEGTEEGEAKRSPPKKGGGKKKKKSDDQDGRFTIE